MYISAAQSTRKGQLCYVKAGDLFGHASLACQNGPKSSETLKRPLPAYAEPSGFQSILYSMPKKLDTKPGIAGPTAGFYDVLVWENTVEIEP